MLNLAYIVLAHESSQHVAEHVRLLADADPTAQLVVHYDARASRREFAALQSALAACPRVVFVPDRIRCEWGKFSLVDAVVRALRVIRDRKLECDYVYLLSGSCVPIRPIALLKRFLRKSYGMEFIEAFSSSWIKDGLRDDRYTRYHWFSWRTQRRLFDASVFVQRKLRIRRRPPQGLSMRFGSQWWCMTFETCMAILDYIDKRPGAYRFFRTTWIPDELFFSTMAATIAGEQRIAQKHLTFFLFSAKGRPITFYDDHRSVIQELPYFFVRKISPTAGKLRQSLQAVAAAPGDSASMPSLDSARASFRYDHHLSRNVDFARPGQIFYGGQSFTGWPSALGTYSGVFGVLHGPPGVTREIGERLQATLDVTLLGRIFHPDKVDLCARGDEFGGFSATDNKIRDLDRALYLSRLLQRCKGFPFIEMAPGDDNNAEWYFHQSKNILFLPCIPAIPDDEDMRRLYWLLVAAGLPEYAAIRPYEMRPVESFGLIRSIIDGYLDRVFNSAHRRWVNDALISKTRSGRLLPVRWALRNRQRVPPDRTLADELHREFGPVVLPIINAVQAIEFELRHGPGRSDFERLPVCWLQLFERFFADRDGQPDKILFYDPPPLARTDPAVLWDELPEDGQ